jgi:tryptophanyl-tRNA synthetase
VLKDFGGQQFSVFKKALAEVATEKVGRIGADAKRLMEDPAEIDKVLADGAARARAIAGPVMDTVKDIVGLLRS